MWRSANIALQMDREINKMIGKEILKKVDQVYEKNKNTRNVRRNISPIRWDKVMEGRAMVSEVSTCSDLEKLLYIFAEKKTIDEGLSYKEIAMILYPYDSWDGGKTPSWYAVQRAKQLLGEFREWEYANGMVLYCDLESTNGYFLVYSLQTKSDFKKVQEKMVRISEGMLNRITTVLQTLAIPKKQRDIMLQRALEKIKLNIASKNTKKETEKKKKRK